jgi:hypothetical protein
MGGRELTGTVGILVGGILATNYLRNIMFSGYKF